MMNKRRQEILNYILKHGFASADELALHLQVSPITIRRDMMLLEHDERIRRIHGGAIPGGDLDFETNISSRLQLNAREKQNIAQFAVSLIQPGDKLFLDTGSTCYYLAKAMPEHLDITVITQAIDNIIALKMKRGVQVICLGGVLDAILNAFIGPLAENQLESFFADKAFLGAGAIDPQKGCLDDNVTEQRIKMRMNQHARASYMLLDSSKFGRKTLHQSIPIINIQSIITTAAAAASHEHQMKLLQEQGKRIYIADARENDIPTKHSAKNSND